MWPMSSTTFLENKRTAETKINFFKTKKFPHCRKIDQLDDVLSQLSDGLVLSGVNLLKIGLRT